MSEPMEAFKNAFKIPELKNRIIFTLVMLAIYRLGSAVPCPGVDGAALARSLADSGGGLMSFYDMFTGGSFSNATVFALGIMPYITASIILSLLIPVIPSLQALQKSGQEGQRKINDYTRFGTIGLCIIQSIGIGYMLQGMGSEIVPNPGLGFLVMSVITFTTGTAFIMWQGEQISEHGVGNGISLIIFISIVSRMPIALIDMFKMNQLGQLGILSILAMVALMVAVVAGAILVTTGQRRIPVQYPRQGAQRGTIAKERTYLPLRVNQAGVIPIIFASSLLMLPSQMLQSVAGDGAFGQFLNFLFDPGSFMYNFLYAVLIIFFAFFYTAITFNPVEIADNMKKYGGVIIGVRPGKATADYLNRIMTRVTLAGSVFLALVALLPVIVNVFLQIENWRVLSFFGGTSLLILVGVALDTVKQIEQHLIMRHYEGFGGSGGGRVVGRRR